MNAKSVARSSKNSKAPAPKSDEPISYSKPMPMVPTGTIEELRVAVEAWSAACNANQKGVDGQFTPEKARIKLKTRYPKIVI